MKTIRLVHWHEAEGLERQQQLKALGFETLFDFGDGLFAARQVKAAPPTHPVVPDHKVYGTPTVAKLGIKAGFKAALLGSPKGFADSLKPLPARVTFTARPEADADIYICFAKSTPELQAHLLALGGANRQTMWLAWPKKASGVKSDLDGNIVRETGLRAGWVDFKVCAIDDTWSGLAFKRRKR